MDRFTDRGKIGGLRMFEIIDIIKVCPMLYEKRNEAWEKI